MNRIGPDLTLRLRSALKENFLLSPKDLSGVEFAQDQAQGLVLSSSPS
jgi:hypothetical protein